MDDIVLPTGLEVIKELLIKYRNDLIEATNATEAAMQQLKKQLNTMERNQIAIAAQKALLDTLEKDVQQKESNVQKPS